MPDKTSSIHFLRFELDPEMRVALRGGAALCAGIDHAAYRHALEPMPSQIRDALLADLEREVPDAAARGPATRIRMNRRYDASDIEVLSGLNPVRKRPGMFTDTTRPNHLVQEVVDNSVDEAIAGHAKRIEVILHSDASVTVTDDGPGMPVDVHPGERSRVSRSS